MERWILNTIACGLSFLVFGFGIFLAMASYGHKTAGWVLAAMALVVLVINLASALRE